MNTFTLTLKFQFPTNGKAYPKGYKEFVKNRVSISFNSLRTGKHIQRCQRLLTQKMAMVRFNSLRTGKHIQSSFLHFY